MVRIWLATTALAGVLASSAVAQTTGGKPAEPATATSAVEAIAPATDIAYIQSLGADQYLATRLQDVDLYASANVDAIEAGEIENFVIGADGTIVAAIVDTGSFLGDQSKTVAVPFGRIQWVAGADASLRPVLTATREDLVAAPAFVVADENPPTAASPAPATDMAASTTAPGTGVAAAPTAGIGDYIATLGPEQYLSQTLIGDEVNAGVSSDSDKIGNINDLILSADGRVDGFVVGVGGFLGLGEKDVGVPFDHIAMTRDENGDAHAALAANKEQLRGAPTFDRGLATDTIAANTTGAVTTGSNATGAAATGVAAGTAAGIAASGTAPTGLATDTTDGVATSSTANAQPSDQLTPMTGGDLSADNLIGASVYGPDNTTIGSIGDLALTPQGQVDAVIVDVGGFLGIGAKPVAVAMDNLQFMRDSAGKATLTTQFTQDQLRGAPEYNKDTYAQNRDGMRVANPGDLQTAPAAGTAQ